MGDGWHYIEEGQERGPVSEHALRSLARSGRVTRDTSVWRSGMPEWGKAGEVGPVGMFGTEDDTLSAEVQLPSLPAVPESGYTAASLYRLWVWYVMPAAAALPVYYLMEAHGFSRRSVVLVIILLAVLAAVAGYTLLYRCWALIQDGGKARVTPGKAVGYCFIPFFNLYWNYIAYVGLAKDMNEYCERYAVEGRRVDEKLAMVWYLLTLSILIPGVGQLFSAAALVTQVMVLRQFADTASAIIRQSETSAEK